MSICTTYVGLIYAKFPPSFSNPKTQIIKNNISLNTPQNFSFFRTITIKRLPMKPPALSPSLSMQQPDNDLPPKLQEIVNLFQLVEDSKLKFKQVLSYAKESTPIDPQFMTEENKVQGCNSQIWVRAYLEPNSENVIFEADSNTEFTKGLAALLVKGLSGLPVEENLRVSPDFIVSLGLQQRLTLSRNNGFLNTLTLMQKNLRSYMQKMRGKTNDVGIKSPVQYSSVTR